MVKMSDDGKGEETGEGSRNMDIEDVAVRAVSVKPPAFEENSAGKWFRILESMFFTSKITTSSTKFHHALSNLPLSVVNRLQDDMIDCKDYDLLKKNIIALYAKSTPELFESLIEKNKICFSKPSVYLHEIRKLGQQLGVNDDFLKIKFLKGLPDNIRPIIVSKEGISLDEMAHAADCIMAYEAGKGSSSVHNVNVAGSPKYDNCNPKYDNGNPNFVPVGSNNNYGNRNFGNTNFSGNRQSRGRGNYANPNFGQQRQQPRQNSNDSPVDYFSDAIPNNVKAFHSNQRPRVCRAHIYFGHYARTCKPWCILKSDEISMQPSSRPASRSSSPVGNPGN